MKIQRFGQSWLHSDFVLTIGPIELIVNECGLCVSLFNKRIFGI